MLTNSLDRVPWGQLVSDPWCGTSSGETRRLGVGIIWWLIRSLSRGWSLLLCKTSAEAFGQKARVSSYVAWVVSCVEAEFREKHLKKATWEPYYLSWPSPGNYVVSLLLHFISWKHHRVLPRFKVRRNRCCLLMQPQGSVRAYGTRHFTVPLLENIVCHHISAVYTFIDRGAARTFWCWCSLGSWSSMPEFSST